MVYPAAYGFIPGTLADDGDPADALVLISAPLTPGCVIRARPIGLLLMEDESGQDEKIICVPHDKIHPEYTGITEATQLPQIKLDAIKHFFEHYKDLEKGKWVKITGWADRAAAEAAISQSFANAAK
jgi:inorganic pyrophosphatase